MNLQNPYYDFVLCSYNHLKTIYIVRTLACIKKKSITSKKNLKPYSRKWDLYNKCQGQYHWRWLLWFKLLSSRTLLTLWLRNAQKRNVPIVQRCNSRHDAWCAAVRPSRKWNRSRVRHGTRFAFNKIKNHPN